MGLTAKIRNDENQARIDGHSACCLVGNDDRRNESIASLGNGFDVARPDCGVADGLPRLHNRSCQDIWRDERVLPDDVEQLLFGHEPVAVLEQVVQNGKRLRLDRDFRARTTTSMRRRSTVTSPN